MAGAELYRIADSETPIETMLAAVGKLEKVNLSGARVLVWPYIRARKQGSIIMPDSAVKEDIYQGAVGYVLKKGPLAFIDDPKQNITFGGFDPKVGAWVTFSPGEGKRIQINGVDCRIFEDSHIQMTVADPDLVTHRK